MTGKVQKCQNGADDLDLDLENEVKVWRSRNFKWPYLGQFSTQNQNVWCSEISFLMALRCTNWKIELTFRLRNLATCQKHINWHIAASIRDICGAARTAMTISKVIHRLLTGVRR